MPTHTLLARGWDRYLGICKFSIQGSGDQIPICRQRPFANELVTGLSSSAYGIFVNHCMHMGIASCSWRAKENEALLSGSGMTFAE
jgi:hypothetical protein